MRFTPTDTAIKQKETATAVRESILRKAVDRIGLPEQACEHERNKLRPMDLCSHWLKVLPGRRGILRDICELLAPHQSTSRQQNCETEFQSVTSACVFIAPLTNSGISGESKSTFMDSYSPIAFVFRTRDTSYPRIQRLSVSRKPVRYFNSVAITIGGKR
jgi:hypothetical protein